MPGVVEFSLLSFSIFLIIIFKIINKNPPPILNVYQQPNGFFWLKTAFMFTILSTRKFVRKIKLKLKKNKVIEEMALLDKPQKLSFHPSAIDAVYFNGGNKNGDYLVVGTARRKNGLVDGFLYLLINSSGFGLLETPKLPATSLYQEKETEEYVAEGIKLIPVIPMKKWKIIYEGPMKRFENRNEVFNVKIEAEFTSDLPYFNFDTDMDSLLMAKSMAYEKFSRTYFKNLQDNHQTHYEQYGDVKGVAVIGDKEYTIEVNVVRDHTFGTKREWKMFHRYALHFLTTENGDRIHVGAICLPISFSCFKLGYIYVAKDKKMYPVTSCDLQLYQHGEGGVPPLDYAFSFQAGGSTYTVQVNVLHSPHFYLSKDWESKVVERLCTFKVNGIKGWGAAEWQYRNIEGKNVADYNGN